MHRARVPNRNLWGGAIKMSFIRHGMAMPVQELTFEESKNTENCLFKGNSSIVYRYFDWWQIRTIRLQRQYALYKFQKCTILDIWTRYWTLHRNMQNYQKQFWHKCWLYTKHELYQYVLPRLQALCITSRPYNRPTQQMQLFCTRCGWLK